MKDMIQQQDSTQLAAPIESAASNLQSMMNYARTQPRNVKKFLEEAATLATIDEETAASCWYTLKRSGKTIEGPSARLAEFCQTAWGNIWVDVTCREPYPHENTVTAEGRAIDLEKNTAVKLQVTRSIMKSNGQRMTSDMIATTMQAAISIAHRNAVFKLIPGTYVKAILMKAKTVAAGNEATMNKKRTAMMQWFSKIGVTEKEVLNAIGKGSAEDINLGDLAELRGMANAIEQGEATPDELFKKPAMKATKEEAEALFKGNLKIQKKQAEEVSEAEYEDVDVEPVNKAAWLRRLKEIIDSGKLPRKCVDVLIGDDPRTASKETLEEGVKTLVLLLEAPLELVEAALEEEDPTTTLRQMASASEAAQSK